MATTVEYGTYIIDLSTAMLEHPQGLNKPQGQRVVAIRRYTVNFLTDYLRHESSSLPDLLQYLTNEALRPLEIVNNCCETILNGHCGPVHPDYEQAIAEIHDCCQAIFEDIEDMRTNLSELMGTLDIA